MKYTTEDINDIVWVRNLDNYEVRDTVRKMMDAGVWENFLEMQQNIDRIVDMDAVYDYLRFESDAALASVGLHEVMATATVSEIVEEWEKANAPSEVRREDGRPCVTITCGDLDMEVVDGDGDESSESLDEYDIVELMRGKHHGNANYGAWDVEDVEDGVFEMWNNGRR